MTAGQKKLTEKEHVKTIGIDRYMKAFFAAQVECRQDRRLVGLDKVRGAIAHEAALRATGFPERPFNLPRSCGPMLVEMRDVVDSVLPRAITAATEPSS